MTTVPLSSSPFRGLDDVAAVQSSVCRLSAEDGQLAYRGYDVRDLGLKSTFEETAALLLLGDLPAAPTLRKFTADLKAGQKVSPSVARVLKAVPAGADAMSVLRLAVSALALDDPAPLPPAHEAALGQGLRLIAVTPTIVAAWHRLRSGQKPVLPRKSLGFAANLLAMVSGQAPTEDAARALDTALILRADNELNPSTFAARVTASTGADVFGGVTSALSALAGPRHGWHARNVMKVLEEIGAPERVGEWVSGRLAQKAKVAGFGHVVYHGPDPRTELLRTLAEGQSERAGLWQLFRTARELEVAMQREAGQFPIVDFYLAPLYRALGLPVDLFTAVFAVSRMPGWVAHLLEQYGDSRLIRPRAEYVGPAPREYRPIRSRK
jgi:2-methylcitrate synthase